MPLPCLQHLHQKIKACWGEDEAVPEDTLPLSPQDVPTSLQSVLPYRHFDAKRDLFINQNSAGFMLEVAPLLGCSETLLNLLASLVRDALPPCACLQVWCYASPHVAVQLDAWEKRRAAQGQAQAELARRRVVWLKQHCFAPQQDGIRVRDFRFFVAVSLACYPKDIAAKCETLVGTRDAIVNLLSALNLPYQRITAAPFIGLLRDWLCPHTSGYPTMPRWNKLTPLHTQCLALDNTINIYPGHLLWQQQEDKIPWCAQTVVVAEYPQQPTLWQMGDFIGDSMNEARQQPFPFWLCLQLEMLDPEKAAAKAEASYHDRSGKMRGSAARFMPGLKREHADWSYVRERLSEGEKLVDVTLLGTVFSPLSAKQNALAAMTNVFQAKGWRVVKPRYVQWPLFLSTLPLMGGEGAVAELKQLGCVRRATAFNGANLMPLQGEAKGDRNGMLLLGRRGQLSFWNVFAYQGDNYNVATAATSGAGKSCAMQEYIVGLLADKGRCWVVDVGRSYAKTCQWLKGEFLNFAPDSRINLNPFTTLKQLDDDTLSLLKPLLGIMARPKTRTSEEEDSWLEQAIVAVWHDYQHQATLTPIANWLKGQADATAQNLAHLLFPYTKDGMYARWFEGPSSLDFNNPFIVLEMEELNSKRDLRDVVLMLLMHHVNQTIYLGDRKQKKSCLIDEAWDLFKSNNSNTAAFIENGYRRARRYHANFITITQGLDDYYQSAAAKAALDCSGTLWLLKQKGDTIEKLKNDKRLNLDAYRETLLKSVHRGKNYSECIIVNDHGFQLFRLPLDPFSRILYSSKGTEFEAVKYWQEQGLSLLKAVEKVAQEGNVCEH